MYFFSSFPFPLYFNAWYLSIYAVSPQCSSAGLCLCPLPCYCKSDASCLHSLQQNCTLINKVVPFCSSGTLSGQAYEQQKIFLICPWDEVFSNSTAFYLEVYFSYLSFPSLLTNMKLVDNLSRARDISLDLWRYKYLHMTGLPSVQTFCMDFCFLL